MALKLSLQQTTAIEWVRTGTGNAVLIAVAGAGKTTTLLEMIKVLAAGLTAAIVAYNKPIAVEIDAKLRNLNLPAQAGTVHSFGFGALRRANKNIKVEGNKVRDIVRVMGVPKWYEDVVIRLVSHGKNAGIGVLAADDFESWSTIFNHHDLVLALPEEFRRGVDAEREAIRFARMALARSNANIEVIDFDDMCYLPLLLNLEPLQFDFVLLDEAQDTNETRRALVKKMVAPGGRFVAVGDPAQAIYGFTGADADSLERIKRDFNAVELPLTVTYRCPKAVVAVAQQWVSHIVAADTAPEGRYEAISYDEMLEQTFLPTDAILCRKTSPLVSLAYKLIRNGVPCKVEGKAIGQGLIKLVRKWNRIKTVGALTDKVVEWRDREIAKAKAKNPDANTEALEDQVECLLEIASAFDGRENIEVLADRIEKLFGDDVAAQGMLTLATIHRSKGREWERVFWLGRDAWQPSPFARQQWQLGQEINLMYVAATRAKAELIEVSAPPKLDEPRSRAA